MGRIFVGIAGGSAGRCLDAVKNAVKTAAWPGRLAFGVCPAQRYDPALFFQAAGPAALRVLDGENLAPKAAHQTVYSLYSGQEYALQVTPDAVFGKDWDRELLAGFHQAAAERPLLTGVLSPDGIPRTVAVRGFGSNGTIRFAPGMKIRHALRPVRTFFLSPEYLFGPGMWMRTAREEEWDGAGIWLLTRHAYAAGYTAFVPHLPSVCRISSAFLPEERVTEEAMVPAGFEEGAGISLNKREAGAKAYLGVYTPDGRYTVQLPLAEGLRQLILRRHEADAGRVMLATALGRHAPHMPLNVHLTMFENLAELKRLSLCCYCPPEFVRRLQMILPNTYGRQEGAESLLSYGDEGAFSRCKPYFIAEAARQFPAFSHYGYIEMDYLKHPVHPSAVFVWGALTDDKIHLAQVNGVVDAGLVVVPRGKVEWLLATASVLSPDAALGPGDTGLFKCLADTYPDAFVLHPMEKRHMLLSLCQPLISGGMLDDA